MLKTKIVKERPVVTDPEGAAYWRKKYEVLLAAASSAYEDRYRGGYLRGYFAAVDDLEALKAGGFHRLTEAYNIMADHAAKPIVQWRYADRGEDGTDETKAPVLAAPNWFDLRRAVFARDGRRCAQCRSSRQLEIDHIKSVAEGGLPVMENLRVLCRSCNRSRPRGRWVAR